MDTNLDTNERGIRPGALAGGAILLVVGATLLLDNSGLVDLPLRQLIAPLVLMTLGTVIVVEKGALVCGVRERTADGQPQVRLRRRGGATPGLWLIGIGAWMLISQVHLFGLDYHNSWPLIVILSGIVLLIRGVQ